MIQYFSWGGSQPGPLKQLPLLKQSTKIHKISYPHNTITKLNNALTKAQNTEQIDLSHNKISNIEPIFELRKLKIINLSHNQISHLSKGILKLKKIQNIDLSYNLFTQMTSINVLFELFRIRRGECVFSVVGNKVFQMHQGQIQDRIKIMVQDIQRIKQKIQSKKQLKQLEISKSLDIPKRLNTQQMDENKLPIGKQHVALTLSEVKNQIENSLNSLNVYSRKFEVISASEFKGWTQNLLKIFNKQAETVKTLLQAYKNIIKSVTEDFINPLDATAKIEIGFIQATEIQELIKDQHCNLLQALSQSHEVPMASYKVWVHLYRELRNLAENIRWEAWAIIQSQIRSQEIEALKLISPSKVDKNNGLKQEQLEGLLFSKQKQGQQAMKINCSQCFIKDQQIRQLKQVVQFLNTQNSQLKIKLSKIEQEKQTLTQQQSILGHQLKKRQQEILSTLEQKIDASVYQKVLLEQAKGIEDLIKCDRHLFAKTKQMLNNTQKISELCQTATALVKDRGLGIGHQRQGVSQFQFHENVSGKDGMKMPYFNRNSDSHSNNVKKGRNLQNSATSTQKKRKSSYENGLRGQKKQYVSSNSRSNNTLFSLKKTERQQSEQSINQMYNKQAFENRQSRNNEPKVIISDFAVTEPGRQKNNYQLSPLTSKQVLAELVAKKNLDINSILKQKNMRGVKRADNNVKKQRKEKENTDTNIDRGQKIPIYTPFQYNSVKLQDEQPYKNYMKFHLRNSIIQTLEKKGKRHSLNKQVSKEGTLKVLSREKQQKDKKNNQSLNYSCSKLANSDRNLIKDRNLLTARDQVINAKSYGDILGRLRH